MRPEPGLRVHRDGILCRQSTQQLPVKDEDHLKPVILLFEKTKLR